MSFDDLLDSVVGEFGEKLESKSPDEIQALIDTKKRDLLLLRAEIKVARIVRDRKRGTARKVALQTTA